MVYIQMKYIHNLIIATLEINLINTSMGNFIKAHAIMWISDNTWDKLNVKSGIVMIVV